MAVGEQVAEGGPDELLSFEPLEDGHGLEIVDHIERRHVRIETPRRVIPENISVERFGFPVDRAVTIRAGKISFPYSLMVYVRNSLGFIVAEMIDGDSRSFPSDEYSLDLTSPVKLYVEFDSSCDILVTDDILEVEFPEVTEVNIGVRSYHKQPATTIKTTTDPADIMTGISYFGSALKTLSCERSFPTLRGHPPLVEIGEQMTIPTVLEKPDTGVFIEIPGKLHFAYTIAPLAYYLGATVVEGNEALIRTDSGFSHNLTSSSRDLEQEVARVLKQVFFLDCITRTEGLYQVNLFERSQVEKSIDLDFQTLYQEDILSLLQNYLRVPYELIEPHLPKWKLSAYVDERPEDFTSIPFLVNDLAIIKGRGSEDHSKKSPQGFEIKEFYRNSPTTQGSDDYQLVESAPSPQLIKVDGSSTLEQVWVGEGAPLGASKSMLEAYQNRLKLNPTNGNIDITVVCNDTSMGGERDIANEIYGSRKELPFNVDIRRELSIKELRRTLHEETDFFHYIGHIDAGGFECRDGRFDAAELRQTGIVAFFLNACTSYRQGMHLIRAGSVAGVVTLMDIINSGAERIGKTLARLLNQGFPMRAALNIAKNKSIMGGHYLVIGDGSFDIAQSDRILPMSYEVNKSYNGFKVERIVHPHREGGMGSLLYPHIGGQGECYIASGKCGSFEVEDEATLIDLFDEPEIPLHIDGSLVWSHELGSAEDLAN